MDLAFSSDVDPPRRGPIALDLATQEWRTASSLLATSMERYVNACHQLKSAHSNHSYTFDHTSPIRDVFDDTDEELGRLESYLFELRQARAEVSIVRNRSPKLAPIALLPQEPLAYIFELVLLAQHYDHVIPNHSHPFVDTLEFLRHPNTLSSVCAYWHQVFTNTPSLWVYISLMVSGQDKERYNRRASYFIKRAASLPLYVRIHSPAPSNSKDIQQLTAQLAPIAHRIYSLDVSDQNQPSKEMLSSILRCWLKHGTPGTVKELSFLRRRFIEGNITTPGPGSWRLDASQQRLETFFRPIEILRLDGLFPPWHSQAYHGLVHLKLYTGRIDEVDLISLLSQNSRLRTLAFNLDVLNTQPRDIPVTPVCLFQLETLALNSMKDANVWSLLRLITPSSGPLKLSLRVNSTIATANFVQTQEVRAFIQRSNITAVYLSGAKSNNRETWYPRVLSSFPQLRTLALRHYSLIQYDTMGYDCVCSSLRELCLIGCEIDIIQLEQLLRTHSIQALRVADCEVVGNGVQLLPAKEVQNALSALVPNVKCYKTSDGGYSDPCLDWAL